MDESQLRAEMIDGGVLTRRWASSAQVGVAVSSAGTKLSAPQGSHRDNELEHPQDTYMDSAESTGAAVRPRPCSARPSSAA